MTTGKCPACGAVRPIVDERGFCPVCFVTFAPPKRTRKEVLRTFEVVYFVSKKTGVYHAPGCKYLRNVLAENLIETTSPYGAPCSCVKKP